MHGLLFFSLFLLGYTYLGYPLWMLLRARLRPRPVADDPWWRPRVSVVIAARDEEAVLARKLESVLAQPWPRDHLEVLVIDDGSRDGTADVARSFSDRGVRLISLSSPSGKAVALNLGALRARGEVVVFTDARQPLEPEALPWLIAPLADERVGAVSGELALDEGGGGLGLYRRLDDRLRRAEGACGSAVGVTGALWATRRARFVPIPVGILLDDLHGPLCLARNGYRVVVEPRARARDVASPDPRREMRRRVRTLAGNLQLARALPWTLSPTKNPLFLRFLSHKLLRLAAPFALATLFLSNLAIVLFSDGSEPLAGLLFAAQVLFYGAAAVTVPSLPGSPAAMRALGAASRLSRSFVLLHVAAARAVLAFVDGREGTLWRDPAAIPGRVRA